MGVEKDAKGGRESEGKVDPRIARGEQLLASIQSAQGRGADQGNDINALTDEALGLGNDILNNTPPSGSGADSYLQGLKNLGVLNTGIVTMAAVMLLLQEQANATFEAMTTKTEISREAQDMANRVKAILAKLTKPEDTAALPQEVIQYLRENNITVEGKTIDEFLSGKDVSKLSQGDLKAVEMALESASGRASDFVQQTQLKLQQLMQNYNTAVQMTNSLQSMLAESVKSIASSIR
ncbi:secretion protein EspA [Pseudomonas chlororaphis subsp. aurantiaca]|nr:secretion protein EspA [Pseudomonas chlororaphis subsp. aurantiaca]